MSFLEIIFEPTGQMLFKGWVNLKGAINWIEYYHLTAPGSLAAYVLLRVKRKDW